MKKRASEIEKDAAPRWLAGVIGRERDRLSVRAFEAGMALGSQGVRAVDGRIEGWWPALGPLTREERETVRVAVATALVEEWRGRPIPPDTMSGRTASALRLRERRRLPLLAPMAAHSAGDQTPRTARSDPAVEGGMTCPACGKPETENPGIGSDLRPLPGCCPSLRHHRVFHYSTPTRDVVYGGNALVRALKERAC